MADEFLRKEVSTIYADGEDRWIVSLIVGYGAGGENLLTHEEAAKAALELTRDAGLGGTHWYVYDRATGWGRFLEQSEFDRPEVVVE